MNYKKELWESNTGKSVNIVVLDSGVNINSELYNQVKAGYVVNGSLNAFTVSEGEYGDTIGHGTAIVDILMRIVPDANMYCLKMFDDDLSISIEKFIYSLYFILNHIDCDILHISSGITCLESYDEFYNVCKLISEKGIIIVSAFDNDGSISYPAAFPFVIGVDKSDNPNLKISEYEWVDNTVINIRASNSFHRVRWCTPPNTIVRGTSFSSAYISGYVAKIISFGLSDIKDIKEYLRSSSKFVFPSSHVENKRNISGNIKNINKAIVFPFNKEIHSIARFVDTLPFELTGFYDVKYNGKIGRTISSILQCEVDHKIMNYEIINWDDNFDTVILGHCKELSKIINFDLLSYMIEMCKKHHKKVYTFDDISSYISTLDEEYQDLFMFPYISEEHLIKNRFGKMRRISKPVLGIWGTSSRQGKFTLQLILRKKFMGSGYRVGQIGTEPSSLLFGFDEVYPMGYNSSVYLQQFDSIQYLNEKMWEIEAGNPDIIIVGSQSGSVPYDTGNILQYPVKQIDFILGTQPDAFVLCVNQFDDINYIIRSIKFLEGITTGKVIALVLFPLKISENNMGFGFRNTPMNYEEIELTKSKFTEQFNIPVYLLGDIEEMDRLFENCVDFFSGPQ